MSQHRRGPAAVALNDSQCLALGGIYKDENDSWQILSSAELYNKSTNKWTQLPDMMKDRGGPTAAVVGNMVYVIGGGDGMEQLASMEVMDFNQPPTQRRWTLLDRTIATGRSGCAAAVVGSCIYVMGGQGNNSSSSLRSVEIFDTKTKKWSIGPSMTTERYGCAAAVIGTTIYVIGGRNNSQKILNTVECLNVGNGSRWKLLPQPMVTKRFFPAATAIRDCIAVTGGCSSLWQTIV